MTTCLRDVWHALAPDALRQDSDPKAAGAIVLDALQTLYQRGLTSYPRSDNRRLPHETVAEARAALAELTGPVRGVIPAGLTPGLGAPTRLPAIYVDPFFEAHHGIIPTAWGAAVWQAGITDRLAPPLCHLAMTVIVERFVLHHAVPHLLAPDAAPWTGDAPSGHELARHYREARLLALPDPVPAGM